MIDRLLTLAQFDDTDANGNPILIDGGSSGVPGTSIFSANFPNPPGIIFNTDGSVRDFLTTGANDFYNYAPVNYIQLPQERTQITAKGHFEINDNFEVYGSTFFTSSRVPQQLAPTLYFKQ